MIVEIDGLKIFYLQHEGQGSPIILLHGWGASVKAMQGIFNFLAKKNKTVYALDFAGFGLSQQPPPNWGVFDFARLVDSFILKLNLQNPIILGHSFGGRIAIILASQSKAQKLILVDSAGIKPKFSIIRALKIVKYKIKKRLKLNTSGMGSTDYQNLSPTMRGIFVKVVNTHLTKLLKQIKVPTLLIWGKNDVETPLYMAKKINKRIAKSGLVILNNCGHFCFADNFVGFCNILNSFVGNS